MQMQSTYWLEKVLKMISLYVNAILCTLQHIVIDAMQLSGVNSPRSFSASSLTSKYEGWNFNSAKYLFTNDNKIDTCFEVLLSFIVVTSIVYNPLPAMWKS